MHKKPFKIFNLRRQKHGFTLLEVVVSMLVLAFGILGTVAFTVTSMRGNKESLERVDAASVTLTIMSRLIGGSIDWLNLGTSANCGQGGTYYRVCSVNAVLNGKTYKTYYTVCDSNSSEPTGYTGDECNIPDANMLPGAAKPTDLACTPSLAWDGTPNVNIKKVLMRVVWTGAGGDCNKFSVSRETYNPYA